MKLRYMNAEVYEKKNMQVKIDETVVTIPKALVFKSYDSICAVYWEEEDTLYLLPRYDYSRTTARQLTTFLKDFYHYPDDTSIIDVRKWCKDEAEDTVLFANSYRFDTQYISLFDAIRLRPIAAHVARSNREPSMPPVYGDYYDN